MKNQNNICGDRISELRGILEMSQTQFAFATGVASNYINALEKGRRKAGAKMCNRIIEMAQRRNVKIDHHYLRPDLEFNEPDPTS